jgi:hypothetical protein
MSSLNSQAFASIVFRPLLGTFRVMETILMKQPSVYLKMSVLGAIDIAPGRTDYHYCDMAMSLDAIAMSFTWEKTMISAALLRRLRNDLPMSATIASLGRAGPPAKMSEGYFRFLCPGCGEMRATVNPRNNLAHCFCCKKTLTTLTCCSPSTRTLPLPSPSWNAGSTPIRPNKKLPRGRRRGSERRPLSSLATPHDRRGPLPRPGVPRPVPNFQEFGKHHLTPPTSIQPSCFWKGDPNVPLYTRPNRPPRHAMLLQKTQEFGNHPYHHPNIPTALIRQRMRPQFGPAHIT